MRIVIDARTLGWTGIGRYVMALLIELPKVSQDDEFIAVIQPSDRKLITFTYPNLVLVEAPILPYSLSEQLKLPRVLKRLRPDLVHFPHFTVPLAYRDTYITTVHDLTLLDYSTNRPGFIPRLKYIIKDAFMRIVIYRAIRSAVTVITDSRYVSQAIVHRYHIYPASLVSVPLAVNFEHQNAKKAVSKEPVVLYVGNFYSHKNVDRLIDGFLLSDSDLKTRLILVGKADHHQQKLRSAVDPTFLDSGKIVFTGRISDGALLELYRQATIFVFPSLSEGFGLPGLEAMANGTPVLAANASCLPEIYGDAAEYFDPLDTADLASKISMLMKDPERRAQLTEHGYEIIKRFSWRNTARMTYDVYIKAVN